MVISMRVVSHKHSHSICASSQRGTGRLLSATCVGLCAISSTYAAEDGKPPGRDFEEVVVTAQRREESLKDVPISISAITGDQLRAAGVSNMLDLSRSVPGLAVAETGPGRQIIVIRGLGSERGSSSLTGVYLDDVPVTGAQDGFNQSYIDLRAIDLQRVEVLKGPQGTLFGEGAVGGAVRYITKDPDLTDFSSNLGTSFYSTSNGGWSQEANGYLNVPLSETFGLRIAGQYENRSGWIDQPDIGREDINDNEVKHARVKALFNPSTQVTIKALVEIHRNDGGATNIVNQEPREDSIFVQAFDRAAPTGFEDEYELYNVTASVDLGFAELLSSTSRVDINSVQSLPQVVNSSSIAGTELLARDYTQDASIFAQEVRLASTGDGSLNWVLGAFYKDAEMIQSFPSGFDIIAFPGQPDELLLPGLNAGAVNTSQSESMAAFADVSYALTERLRLGGGLRYFYDDREAYGATRSVAFQSGDFDAVTFRVNGTFAITQNVNLYASVGDGFRSGGFNSTSNIARGAPPTFDPESVISYEMGIKSYLLDGVVSLDVAVFYSEYEDMQDDTSVVSPVDGGPVQYTVNDQNAELKGIEWDLVVRATDNLRISLSGDKIDTEITEAPPGSAFVVGDPINFVPEYKVALGATYDFEWGASLPGFARLDLDRQGESTQTARTLGLGIPAQGVAPEVTFLNASVGAEVNGWKFTLFGRNLTNETDIIRAGVTGMTAQARPRTVGVTIGRDF
jgi:iron complex outermembrane recepter protein